MTTPPPHVTAAVDQAVAAVRSGDEEEIEHVLVKLVRTWFDTRPSAVADDDVEELAWQLARTAVTAPTVPCAGSGTWHEQTTARLYVSYAQSGRREEARAMWQNLALTPQLNSRRGAALASIRLVQVITALARCHSTDSAPTQESPPPPATPTDP